MKIIKIFEPFTETEIWTLIAAEERYAWVESGAISLSRHCYRIPVKLKINLLLDPPNHSYIYSYHKQPPLKTKYSIPF